LEEEMREAMVHSGGDAVREAETALRGRVRTCVGCAAHLEADSPEGADLVRLVLGPEGEIVVDARGGGFGRGAHVHARPDCLERAARGGLARSTKGRAAAVLTEDGARHPLDARSLARAIQEAMERRIEGLFATAVRSRQLACGADAVAGACHQGHAALVVVARDAPGAAEASEVSRAIAEGRAVAWGDKRRLGEVCAPGRPGAAPSDVDPGVGVVAVLSRQLAEGLLQAVRLGDACASQATGTGSVARPARSKRGGSRSGVGPRSAEGNTPRPPGRGRPPQGRARG
jgi:predicted RNA-binding protein YlxR (DUF448 family)/ribosomal protein L7Ae-like RNA K-turn-binding protein